MVRGQQMHNTECELREAVVTAARHMAATGLVTGTSGNVSVRHGDRVLITPSGVDYATLEPEGVALVSMDGAVLDGGAGAPSSETPLHLTVYANSADEAVVHTHSPWATAVGLVRDVLPSVHYGIRALGGPVRVAAYATFGSRQLAENVREAMEGRRGALMRNHGAVVTGSSLQEATRNAELLEWLCQLFHRACAMGEPAVLTEEELDDVRRSAQTTGYRF
jgi:L-fuculose-phosphate aldolase